MYSHWKYAELLPSYKTLIIPKPWRAAPVGKSFSTSLSEFTRVSSARSAVSTTSWSPTWCLTAATQLQTSPLGLGNFTPWTSKAMCTRSKCYKDRHHLRPRARGKGDNVTIKLHRCRHQSLHRLFGILTLTEVIDLLSVRSDKCAWIVNQRFLHYRGDEDWCIAFGDKSVAEVVALLTRVKVIKYGWTHNRGVLKPHLTFGNNG